MNEDSLSERFDAIIANNKNYVHDNLKKYRSDVEKFWFPKSLFSRYFWNLFEENRDTLIHIWKNYFLTKKTKDLIPQSALSLIDKKFFSRKSPKTIEYFDSLWKENILEHKNVPHGGFNNPFNWNFNLSTELDNRPSLIAEIINTFLVHKKVINGFILDTSNLEVEDIKYIQDLAQQLGLVVTQNDDFPNGKFLVTEFQNFVKYTTKYGQSFSLNKFLDVPCDDIAMENGYIRLFIKYDDYPAVVLFSYLCGLEYYERMEDWSIGMRNKIEKILKTVSGKFEVFVEIDEFYSMSERVEDLRQRYRKEILKEYLGSYQQDILNNWAPGSRLFSQFKTLLRNNIHVLLHIWENYFLNNKVQDFLAEYEDRSDGLKVLSRIDKKFFPKNSRLNKKLSIREFDRIWNDLTSKDLEYRLFGDPKLDLENSDDDSREASKAVEIIGEDPDQEYIEVGELDDEDEKDEDDETGPTNQYNGQVVGDMPTTEYDGQVVRDIPDDSMEMSNDVEGDSDEKEVKQKEYEEDGSGQSEVQRLINFCETYTSIDLDERIKKFFSLPDEYITIFIFYAVQIMRNENRTPVQERNAFYILEMMSSDNCRNNKLCDVLREKYSDILSRFD